MADQKINELPTKTAPSTGDKMLMIGTAEEYQIDYDQLATAILNKLSTQSFSSLDTTSKTVLGAIDELNSKSGIVTETNALNAVEKIKSELWDTFDNGIISKTFTTGGPLFYAIGYKTANIYGSIVMFSYYTERPLYVRALNGEWSVPVYI